MYSKKVKGPETILGVYCFCERETSLTLIVSEDIPIQGLETCCRYSQLEVEVEATREYLVALSDEINDNEELLINSEDDFLD
ncbi:predicted protein [Botrytis cinerea T4]|uniref:Uncharacterized protein n=1 Tax=Botryotinia fuckeliana (strain T4) TaxID=999810 RepID=G2YL52_BOTF4|nr:predicted protein [Botrytis cinerea T4]